MEEHEANILLGSLLKEADGHRRRAEEAAVESVKSYELGKSHAKEDAVKKIRMAIGRSNNYLLDVLRNVTDEAVRNHCGHETTHRGGVIWEICDDCGARWADDEGGKPENAGELHEAIKRAYEILR